MWCILSNFEILTSSITHDVRLCDNGDVKFIIPIMHVMSLRNFVLGEQCRRGQCAASCIDLVFSVSGSITYDPPNVIYQTQFSWSNVQIDPGRTIARDFPDWLTVPGIENGVGGTEVDQKLDPLPLSDSILHLRCWSLFDFEFPFPLGLPLAGNRRDLEMPWVEPLRCFLADSVIEVKVPETLGNLLDFQRLSSKEGLAHLVPKPRRLSKTTTPWNFRRSRHRPLPDTWRPLTCRITMAHWSVCIYVCVVGWVYFFKRSSTSYDHQPLPTGNHVIMI